MTVDPEMVEFMSARILDDERRELRALLGDPSIEWTPEIEKRFRGTLAGASVGFRAGMRRVALAASLDFQFFNAPWLRREVARYADHPDYKPEWVA